MQSLLVGAEEGPQVTAVSLGRTSCHAGVPNGQQHPKGPPWCRRTGRLGVKGLLRGGCSWLPGSHRKGVCGLGGAGLRVPKAAKDKGSFLCGHEPPPPRDRKPEPAWGACPLLLSLPLWSMVLPGGFRAGRAVEGQSCSPSLSSEGLRLHPASVQPPLCSTNSATRGSGDVTWEAWASCVVTRRGGASRGPQGGHCHLHF